MASLKLWIWVFMAYCIDLSEARAQCQTTFGSLLGSVVENERGYSLTASPDGKYIYVGGIRKDSAIIIKVSISGDIQWTRSFNVVPGREDHIHRLFVDADGMLGVAGTAGTQTNGGTIFAFRYDPENNKVLWANEYISTSNNYSLGMIEKSPGGNYLMTNNPQNPNVAELIELDKNNGNILSGFSKHYDLGSSESIYDFAFHNGMMYASGRFTDGGSVSEMRNTLIKMDPTNGDILWMKLGHKPANVSARFYGFDLVILQDQIYSIYNGDETGASVDNTKLFIQKADLNGNLIWIKKYDLPVANDWGDELIESDGGLVVLARNRVAPSNIILFKINTAGDMVWSNEYDFSLNDNATPLGSIQSQLIEASEYLYFTAYAEDGGPADMILAKTDLEGKIQDTCSTVRPITIAVSSVVNPVIYDLFPTVYDYVPQRKSLSISAGKTTSILNTSICKVSNVASSFTDEVICMGDVFEGYSQTGIYQDTFLSSTGCDSIRILTLSVVPNITTTIQVEICAGDEFEGYSQTGIYQDTFLSSTGCDSVRTITLFVIPGITSTLQAEICAGDEFEGYIQTGIYQDTFLSIAGCDSIRTLNLSVLPGISSNFQGDICAGDEFEGYTQTGIYQDTFLSSTGCDSVRTITLFVIPVITSTLQAEICAGDEFEGYTQTGIYQDTFLSSTGCDSIRTITLSVVPSITSTLQVEICVGDEFDGYTQTGVYQDTFLSITGCDSIRTLFLSVVTSISLSIEAKICPGDEYEGYDDSSMYVDTFTSSFGCDSIRTLLLTVALPTVDLASEICSGGSVYGYYESGFYTDTLPGILNACDTIRFLTLTVLPPMTTSVDVTICSGEQYYNHTSTGLYTDTIVNSMGCDSIRIVNLQVIEDVASYVQADACSATEHGHIGPGIYTDTLMSSFGCDSIRTVSITGVSSYIPNVFSPNQDNINDIFEIVAFPINEIELTYFVIFDRFGNMVYENRSWPIRWDGRDKHGEYYNPAVFTYILTYLCNQKEIVETGNITLIR